MSLFSLETFFANIMFFANFIICLNYKLSMYGIFEDNNNSDWVQHSIHTQILHNVHTGRDHFDLPQGFQERVKNIIDDT